MKVNFDQTKTIREVVLSRRNLVTLLNKLDREDSEKTIFQMIPGLGPVFIRAEDDAAHYAGREPGEMHPLDVPQQLKEVA